MPAGTDKPVCVPYRQHVPPDVVACIFWLKNRRPDLWRDRQDHRHKIIQETRSAAELFAELQAEAAEHGIKLTEMEDGSFEPIGIANRKGNGEE
jgi:hypothetical protein